MPQNHPTILFPVFYRHWPENRVVSSLILLWCLSTSWPHAARGVGKWNFGLVENSGPSGNVLVSPESTRHVSEGSMPQNGAALWIVWKRKEIHQRGVVMTGKADPNEHENGRS
jgi:hypothetical protein